MDPDKMPKALDAKTRSSALVQCIWHKKLCIMLKDGGTVEKTRDCLAREDVFPIKKWKNVNRVSSSKLEDSFLHDCNEAAFDYVANGLGTAVLDLTGENVARE